jgi:hypothetical protein
MGFLFLFDLDFILTVAPFTEQAAQDCHDRSGELINAFINCVGQGLRFS